MSRYSVQAYAAMHQGIGIKHADLKTEAGQKTLHTQLAKADVLLTSFRPSALARLGLSWKALHRQYPQLSQVAIVGGAGAQAEEPGHDLTYLAMAGLVTGLGLPATLYADMAGSLEASQAVLCSVIHTQATGKGTYFEVPLASAATHLALPLAWGLTTPGGAVGGGHAGYQVYACQNGRVAVAALEPHFAARLCAAASLPDAPDMLSASVQQALRTWLLAKTRAQLDQLAFDKDIPLLTMA